MKRRLYLLLFLLCFVSASVFVSSSVYATNGMDLEGYGPIATGMGGASMAYDNGTAAMMNNPATLGLMPEGDRLDVALGYLGPHVNASAMGMSSQSSASSFYMPALGWVRKSGQFTFGAGVFSQGGMGTEYPATSFLAAGSGDKVRSEVGVGRVLFPLAYEVNKNLSIGGSLDFVWASMDIKMAVPGSSFLDMVGAFGGTQTFGSVSGTAINTFGTFFPVLDHTNPVNFGRFDFSDDSPFTGKAKGTGFAGKIGAVYKVNDKLSVGGSYHSKTALSDLEADGATVSFNINADSGFITTHTPNGVFVPVTVPLTGKIKIKDFEWPQTVGVGASYEATDKLMLVFDYKWINWANVMKNFHIEFDAGALQSGMGSFFAGNTLDVTFFQKWKNQNVFELGAGYKVTDAFTVRAGVNIANNPVPDFFANPLFPAIIKNHYMVGAGYMISKASSVDASFTYAPKVKVTNGDGITITHFQTNGQIMYSYRF